MDANPFFSDTGRYPSKSCFRVMIPNKKIMFLHEFAKDKEEMEKVCCG